MTTTFISPTPTATTEREGLMSTLDFVLPPGLEAREPAESRLGRRDAVRMLVSDGDQPPLDAAFADLPDVLDDGDLLVVNTSSTIPAAFDATHVDGRCLVVHLSTRLPAGLWVLEVRQPADGGASEPFATVVEGDVLSVPGGSVRLLNRYPDSQRLWVASFETAMPTLDWLAQHGRPIRYGYVPDDWPIDVYQTVFGTTPGSAEMPSASRPFTPELVARLVSAGVGITPIQLHTGVSSLEAHEVPYPEPFVVPESTAERINDAHRHHRRVIAIGTTVVRALESAADEQGVVHPNHGWADVIITPERGVRAVDGLLTGWHEPQASHLSMLEAVAGLAPLTEAYAAGLARGYLWHEFGDVHLILRAEGDPA
jgi:S-adenosylmethionine:tRNA ribosyltransferase-isomerase